MHPATAPTRGRSSAARSRLNAYALRWIATIAFLVALAFIRDGYIFLIFVFLGPWFGLSIALESQQYLFAFLFLLWGLATPFIIPLAWILYALPKRTALYLRRFQLTNTSGTMSDAIEKGLGRRLRVVTLDDHSFSPLEAPIRVRRITRWVPITLAIGILGGFLLFVVLAGMRYSPTFVDWIWGAIAMSGFIAVPGIIATVLYLALLLAVFPVLRRRVRSRGRLQIVGPWQIAAAIARVRLLSARWRGASILEPQATVIEVTDDAWQPTVQTLIRETACAIFDVSQPTANVLWELEQVFNGSSQCRVVLVADDDLFHSWPADAGAHEMLPRVRALLQDRSILMYRDSGWRARRRFRKGLCRAVDAIA